MLDLYPWMRWPEESLRRGIEKTLLKRVAEPAESADLITYLGFGASFGTGNGSHRWRSDTCMSRRCGQAANVSVAFCARAIAVGEGTC